MEWVLALSLKPFVAVVFLLAAYYLSRLLWRFIPDGRIKRILYSPLDRKSRR